jgi:hypothetical protein
MGKIILKDMQIRVRKKSDKSEGWINMDELVDTICESVAEINAEKGDDGK